MSKRRPAPWVPLSVYYYDDAALMEAGEFAEVMFTRMMAYAGRHRGWNGRLPRTVALTRLGLYALENVPESAPEKRLERLLESGLVTAHEAHVQLEGWLKWNDPGEQVEANRDRDRSRKSAPTREDAQDAPEVAPESALESALESGTTSRTGSGAQDKSREEETKASLSDVADATPDEVRDDVERICQHLAERIKENGSRRPRITKAWRTEARLLLDRDGKTESQVIRCIDWCQDDPFWKTNILSMPKLREKYDQLRLKAAEKSGPTETERRDALGFRIAS